MSNNQMIKERLDWFLDFLASKENTVHTEINLSEFIFRFVPNRGLEVLKDAQWINIKRAPIMHRAAALMYAFEINKAIDTEYHRIPEFIREAISTFDSLKSSLNVNTEMVEGT